MTALPFSSSEPSPPYTSPLFTPRESKFGRQVFEATLEKDGTLGIGLTIVGGETTNSLDLGIFIKSVVPGGPADRDGRIMPGDRLIAIGGVSLEGKQHREAVAMIRDGGPRVTLLISQIRPPGTLKKRNLHDEQAEFEKKLRNSMLEYNDIKHGWPSLSEGSINDLETFLRFDDFVDNVYSNIDRNIVCNSDEENYPLEPPSTLSSSSARVRSTPYLNPGDSVTLNKTESSTENQQTTSNAQNKMNLLQVPKEKGRSAITKDHSGSLNLPLGGQTLQGSPQQRDVLHNLRDEQEINFERSVLDWSSIDVIQSRDKFSFQGLTEDDRDHLQMLGGR